MTWHPYAPVYINSTFTSQNPSHSIWNIWQDSHFFPGVTNYIHYMPAEFILHLKKVPWQYYRWYHMPLSLIYTECCALVLTLQRIPYYYHDTQKKILQYIRIILETTVVPCHFLVSKCNVTGKSSAVHWPAHQKSSKLLHNYPVGKNINKYI